MKKFFLLLSSAIMAAPLVGISPAAAQPSAQTTEVQGGFQMTVHSHSSGKTLFPVDRLAYDFAEGDDFSYSSRPCSGNARFNDVGLNFNPDYPGVDDDADGTAPVRHIVQGAVTEVNGDRGTIEGTITSVLCVTVTKSDGTKVQTESANKIVTNFTAKYRQASNNELRLAGTFEISPTLSTGTFADLEGRGSINAILTCLSAQRDPSLPSCSDQGVYTDFVAVRGDSSKGPGEIKPGLVGSFRDATVQPV